LFLNIIKAAAYLDLELLSFLVGSKPCATTKVSKRVRQKDLFKYVLHHFPDDTDNEQVQTRLMLFKSPLIVIIGERKYIKTGSVCLNVSRMSFNNIIEIYFKLFKVFGIDYTPECYNLLFLFEKLLSVNENERVAVNEIMNLILHVDE
jgi:hypothetical protein